MAAPLDAQTRLSYIQPDPCHPDVVALLELARPKRANALSAQMIAELSTHLDNVANRPGLRLLAIRALGKNFSGGADLDWMKASARLNHEQNVEDAKGLQTILTKIAELPVPTAAAVQGACYGGAVGLVAACDYVIASHDARFCLSEVKVGLIPAMIWPFLAQKVNPGFLRAMAISARVFSSTEAINHGLIHASFDVGSNPSHGSLDNSFTQLCNQLLCVSPSAVGALKTMSMKARSNSWDLNDEKFCHAIAAQRTSVEGQAGLQAFFDKTTTPWTRQLDESNLFPT